VNWRAVALIAGVAAVAFWIAWDISLWPECRTEHSVGYCVRLMVR